MKGLTLNSPDKDKRTPIPFVGIVTNLLSVFVISIISLLPSNSSFEIENTDIVVLSVETNSRKILKSWVIRYPKGVWEDDEEVISWVSGSNMWVVHENSFVLLKKINGKVLERI